MQISSVALDLSNNQAETPEKSCQNLISGGEAGYIGKFDSSELESI
jgi:hypothetical protein